MHKRSKASGKNRKATPGIVETFLNMPKLPTRKWRRAFAETPRKLPTSHLKRWQLQEAKAKFSEVFDRAFKDGPQVVSRRNKEAVVILPEEQFQKLADDRQQPPTPGMLEVLLKCPKGRGLKIPPRNKRENVLDLPSVFD